MSTENILDLLDVCLDELHAGATIDEILKRHPAQSEELRPLLDAALFAGAATTPLPIPTQAASRSRARFLTEAARRSETARKKPALPFLRLFKLSRVFSLAAVLAVILLTLGTGFASAASLPGDMLYPVKRSIEKARLGLTVNPSSRLSLEEKLDQTRAAEAARLLALDRPESIHFAGFLASAGDGWSVAGLPVAFTGGYPEQWKDAYVEIDGTPIAGVIHAAEPRLRLFELQGIIEQAGDGEWVVSGIPVKIDFRTNINGPIQSGSPVRIAAARVDSSGALLALAVSGENATPVLGTLPVVQATMTPSPVMATPFGTGVPILEVSATASVEPGEIDDDDDDLSPELTEIEDDDELEMHETITPTPWGTDALNGGSTGQNPDVDDSGESDSSESDETPDSSDD